MIIDSSALVAILQKEPEAETFVRKIKASKDRFVSAATLAEAGIVLEHKLGYQASIDLDLAIVKLGIKIHPVDERQADLARRAYREFGKGIHPAGLNFGDCFAYALAKNMGLPLLFKGTDFSKTDIQAC